MSQEDKLQKLHEELKQSKEKNADLEQQLRMRESERDLLAVMLYEAENPQGQSHDWAERVSGQFEDNRWAIRQRGEYEISIFDKIQVGIVVVTDGGTIQTTNQWVKHLTGYSRLELIGKNIGTLFGKDNDDQTVMGKLTDLGSARMLEIDLMRKTGEMRVVGLTINARKADRILIAIFDLSNRQRLDLD